ncbi:heat intolerant 4-like protein, partial [Tanacetum coccineum]
VVSKPIIEALTNYYNPFAKDETEESTIVELLYLVEHPFYCEFDWEVDKVEEELSEDQKDAFKKFLKEMSRKERELTERWSDRFCALYDVGAVMVVHAVLMDCKLMLEKSSNNYEIWILSARRQKGLKAKPTSFGVFVGYQWIGAVGYEIGVIRGVAMKVFTAMGLSLECKVGTMIKIRRAALIADSLNLSPLPLSAESHILTDNHPF